MCDFNFIIIVLKKDFLTQIGSTVSVMSNNNRINEHKVVS
jgi:hypothetical protein